MEKTIERKTVLPQEIAMIALDMDGTLLNSHHVTTAYTRAALERAAKAGKIVAIATGRCLSELATLMQRFPQTMVNIQVSPEGKLAFYTDHKVKEAIDRAAQTLGRDGRIIVRPSGTEPLLRVMVEGQDEALIEKLAQDVAQVIREELV